MSSFLAWHLDGESVLPRTSCACQGGDRGTASSKPKKKTKSDFKRDGAFFFFLLHALERTL